MNKFLSFLAFFILIIISIAVFHIKNVLPVHTSPTVNGKIGDTPIRLEVSNNASTREKGLSGRLVLKDNEGMLFVFLESDNYGFWMRDMKFPIDIIWINENFRVIGIEKNVLPNTYPASFYPPSPVKFVIETKAGFSNQNNLKVGDPVSWESQNLILQDTF